MRGIFAILAASVLLAFFATDLKAGTFSGTGNAKPCGFIIYGDSKTDGIVSDWPKVLADAGYPLTLAGHSGAKISDTYTSSPLTVPPVQRQMFRTGGACQEQAAIFGGASDDTCLEDMAAAGQLRSCHWVLVDTGTNDSSSVSNWAVRQSDYETWMVNIIDEANLRGLRLAIIGSVPFDIDGSQAAPNLERNLTVKTMVRTNIPNAIGTATGTDPLLVDTYTPLEDIYNREGEAAFRLLYDDAEVHPRNRGVELVGEIILRAVEAEHTRRLLIPTGVNGGTFR